MNSSKTITCVFSKSYVGHSFSLPSGKMSALRGRVSRFWRTAPTSYAESLRKPCHWGLRPTANRVGNNRGVCPVASALPYHSRASSSFFFHAQAILQHLGIETHSSGVAGLRVFWHHSAAASLRRNAAYRRDQWFPTVLYNPSRHAVRGRLNCCSGVR